MIVIDQQFITKSQGVQPGNMGAGRVGPLYLLPFSFLVKVMDLGDVSAPRMTNCSALCNWYALLTMMEGINVVDGVKLL